MSDATKCPGCSHKAAVIREQSERIALLHEDYKTFNRLLSEIIKATNKTLRAIKQREPNDGKGN